MSGNDVLHHSQERAALAFAALKMLKLLRENHGFGVELGIQQSADQISDLLDARRILLKNLPYQRRGLAQAVGAQQRFRIQIAEFNGSIAGAGQRIQYENSGADLLLLHQTAGITKGNYFI